MQSKGLIVEDWLLPSLQWDVSSDTSQSRLFSLVCNWSWNCRLSIIFSFEVASLTSHSHIKLAAFMAYPGALSHWRGLVTTG